VSWFNDSIFSFPFFLFINSFLFLFLLKVFLVHRYFFGAIINEKKGKKENFLFEKIHKQDRNEFRLMRTFLYFRRIWLFHRGFYYYFYFLLCCLWKSSWIVCLFPFADIEIWWKIIKKIKFRFFATPAIYGWAKLAH
jgi:hypothetical protein